MYPEGFHPIQRGLLPDYSRMIKPLPRSEAVPKYYYTSFDISVLISTGTADEQQTIISEVAPPPELAAFRVDISAMGTLFEKEFFEVRDAGFDIGPSPYHAVVAVCGLGIHLAAHTFDGEGIP